MVVIPTSLCFTVGVLSFTLIWKGKVKVSGPISTGGGGCAEGVLVRFSTAVQQSSCAPVGQDGLIAHSVVTAE